MKRLIHFGTIVLAVILLTVSMGTRPGLGQSELVVVTHNSFAASESVIAEFEKANNTKVRILKAGDTGKALNQVILTANNPLGDLFFGVDSTFLTRALKEDLFVPYRAQGLDKIPAEFKLDPTFRVTPIDYGDVCLNYDKAWFKQKNLAPPAKLEDLAKPEFKNLLVVENPATSSPGLSFLLTTVAHFGEGKYLDFWKQLRANNVMITEGWSDAYYSKSTWSKKGDRPIVVSYATSPAAEVFFSGGKVQDPPTGNVIGDGTCFRQIEFAGVFNHAKHPDLAQKFIDYMIGQKFQEDLPLQMFVFPVLPGVKLPEVYKFAERPKKPAVIGTAQIDANREKWINAWTTTVLR
jgi:thiamine transport system substrate-binding protein